MITSTIKTDVMKKIFFILLGLAVSVNIMAQDSIAVKEEAPVKKAKFTKATFKSTRLINRQTVEIMAKGNMQFMIAHHFSYFWNKDLGITGAEKLRQNAANLFGLNTGIANTYLSFDYSPLNWANVGLAAAGRTRYEGWAKFKILRQQTGLKNIPVTIGWYSMASIYTSKKEVNEFVSNRWAFVHQLTIARKFSDDFSLQLMPTLVHLNLVPYGTNNSNNIFSMGVGARYKINSKRAINLEYSRQFNMYENVMDKNGNILQYNPDLLSIGLEMNTGGHVFEFFIGNTMNSSAVDQLTKNASAIKDGQFALGFHLNRGYPIGGKNK